MNTIERIISALAKLHSMNLFPEVALAALAGYFLAKQWFKVNPKIAIYIPVLIAFAAEFAFAWPKNFQDVLLNVVMSIFHCGTAVGIYSMADKYNLIEKFWNLITRQKTTPQEAMNDEKV